MRNGFQLVFLGVFLLSACGGSSTSSTTSTETESDSNTNFAASCSTSDQFTMTDLGTVIDADLVGIEVGETIADSSGILLDDGTIRKYFFANGQGIRSATTTDGTTFTMEDDIVIEEGSASHQKVFELGDGSIRLFTGVDSEGGIISYLADDGLTFEQEDGVRISSDDTGIDMMSHLSVVEMSDGTYRGYFSHLPTPGVAPMDDTRQIFTATSTDMLTWTLSTTPILGGDDSDIEGPVEQPFALKRSDDCVTLFYYKAAATGDNKLYYSTSTDGVTFETEFESDIDGNGPDIIVDADGTAYLYYDTGDADSGFTINAATITLDD